MQEVLYKYPDVLVKAFDVDSFDEDVEDVYYKLGDVVHGGLNTVDSSKNYARGLTDEAFELNTRARDDDLHLGNDGGQIFSGTVLSGHRG